MKLNEKLDRIVARYEELGRRLAEAELASGDRVKLGREHAELAPLVEGSEAYRRVHGEIAGLLELLAATDTEAEMRALAAAELEDLRRRERTLQDQVKLMLLPRDAADDRNVILELRAGTGGEEAALFAADLFRMYLRYAELHGWRGEVMAVSETGLGGFKEATLAISGRGAFGRLKYESGVHRVQRVPRTEASGRIHTSAATVAVLPEAEDVEVRLDERDLRIDVFRASGPGGQSVNTTDSAVRVTHLPTGIVVTQQDEKSQHKNRAKAMRILRARLYDRERAARAAERAALRRSQVGTGDRSERIRTYNFPQGRVTDHRVNLSLHDIEAVMNGEALDRIVDTLAAEDQAALLAVLE